METLTFDFEFNQTSLNYGRFVVDVLETCPDAKIEDVTSHHPYKTGMRYFCVDVPKELAVLLKLRFGAHMKRRPASKPKEEKDFEGILNMKILKNRQHFNKNIYYDFESQDYFDSLKEYKKVEKNPGEKDYFSALKEIYNKIK